MSALLPELSFRDIARREEARQAIGVAEVAREAEALAGGWLSFDAPGSWANQACGLAMDRAVSSAELDRLVSFYTERGVEPRIEVSPFVDESLLQGLAVRGFVLRSFEEVYYRQVGAHEDLRAALPHGWPEGLKLPRLDPDDADALEAFVDVSTSGFRPAGAPISPVFASISRRVARHPCIASFAALWHGKLVGGGAVEIRPEVSCLVGTSVLPEARRRGIQLALVVRRMEAAREQGCSLVVIHGEPGIPTGRNARRLGFALAYTKVTMVLPGEGLVASQ